MNNNIKVCLINSIRNKPYSDEAIKHIIFAVKKTKGQIIHEHVSSMNQQKLNELSKDSNLDFHRKVFSNIRASHLIISECSKESLSVGFLLSYALEHEKPLIIFIKKGCTFPNLFTYLSDEKKIYIVEYSSYEELQILTYEYIDLALSELETRFNFYISPELNNYVKWAAKKSNVSKSAFVRKSLEEIMATDRDYLT